MAVKRHGSKWRADWRDEFQLRRRRDFETKAEAEVHEREMRVKARAHKTGEVPACNAHVTFGEYVKGWLAKRSAHGIDPGTVARNEIDLRLHVLPKFASRKVREVQRTHVKTLLESKLVDGQSTQGEGRKGANGKVWAKRTEKHLARGSVQSIYHTLSAVLSEAVADRFIIANPNRGLWKRLRRRSGVAYSFWPTPHPPPCLRSLCTCT
jgi:hypothetical protein